MADQTEAKIAKVAEDVRAKGKPFPLNVSDIPNLPFDSFDNLMAGFKMRSVILQRFSVHYDNNIFELFASSAQKSLNTIYIALAFVVPIACIALAIFHSWWWLLGLPSLLFFLGRSKKLYNKVILSAAFKSELKFCFLYVTGQICVTTSDFSESYYWESR